MKQVDEVIKLIQSVKDVEEDTRYEEEEEIFDEQLLGEENVCRDVFDIWQDNGMTVEANC